MIRIILSTLIKVGFFIFAIFPCVVQAQDRVAVDMGSDWLRRDWDRLRRECYGAISRWRVCDSQ